MPPMVRFVLQRVLSIPVSLLIATAILYAFIMVTPPEERAGFYLPKRIENLPAKTVKTITNNIIETHHLRDPYPVQYAIWLGYLVRGDWGYSPTLQDEVLPWLLRRSAVTAELTLYALLFLIPLSLSTGLIAGWRKDKLEDTTFRLTAFVASSTPPFILALVLIAIFYVNLQWFPIDRIDLKFSSLFTSGGLYPFTGLLTIDGLLNGRIDVTLNALRHLVLPVISLSMLYWATIGRVTRITAIEELQKDYVIAARARGIPSHLLIWKHSLRNVLAPTLTSSALSATSLFTGAFVIEALFNLKGLSVILSSVGGVPDAVAVMGFATFSVITILLLMFILDILQAIFDPRLRESITAQ